MPSPAPSTSVPPQQSLFESVKEVYENIGYGQQYGIDILITIFIIGIFFWSIAYFYILGHIRPIKADWPKNRCNPAYIPFAGMINSPEGSSSFDYTGENFEYCTQNILKDISGYFLQPFYYLLHLITETLNEMSKAVNAIRAEFNKHRAALANITAVILAKVQNILVPLTQVVISARDILGKTTGILMTGLYTLMGTYMGLSSVFAIIIEAIIVALVIVAALIIGLWFIPVIGPPLAIADTIIFVAILAIFIIFKVFLSEVMDIASGDAPPIPACFAKGTLVAMKQGSPRPIEDLVIGDILSDDSIVTGTMQMNSLAQEIYNINGTLVTAKHRLYHPDMGLIQVINHPAAIHVVDFREPFVYCVNTSSKNIRIGHEVYVDWDDLDPMDLHELNSQCNKIGILNGEITIDDIHRYLECGVVEDTMVELDDGRSLPIQNIAVNDVLRFGERVLGTVKLDAKEVVHVKEYYLDGSRVLRASGNVFICDNDLGTLNTYRIAGTDILDTRYLYHLVTDSGTFVVDGIRIGDYNTGLEQHLKPTYFLSC